MNNDLLDWEATSTRLKSQTRKVLEGKNRALSRNQNLRLQSSIENTERWSRLLDDRPLDAVLLDSSLNGSRPYDVIECLEPFLEPLVNLQILSSLHPREISVSHISGIDNLDGVFAYDLQAPSGARESWFSVSFSLGYMRACCEALGTEYWLGIAQPSLAKLNRQALGIDANELVRRIENRQANFGRFGVNNILDFGLPQNAEELVERVRADEELHNIFNGQIVQVLNAHNTQRSDEEINIAWLYFVSQISEMLNYQREEELQIHLGADSEQPWDRVMEIMANAKGTLKERIQDVFGVSGSSFMSVHYNRPLLEKTGQRLLPYAIPPQKERYVPMIGDATSQLEQKFEEMDKGSRRQLFEGVCYAVAFSHLDLSHLPSDYRASCEELRERGIRSLLSERKNALRGGALLERIFPYSLPNHYAIAASVAKLSEEVSE